MLGARPRRIVAWGKAVSPCHGGPCPGKVARLPAQPRSFWNALRSFELHAVFLFRPPPPPSHPLGCHTAPSAAVVHEPTAGTGTTGYPANAPTIVTLLMLQQLLPFAWKLDLRGRKSARVGFVAATWQVDVETQGGEQTPHPLRMSFPCAVTVSGV